MKLIQSLKFQFVALFSLFISALCGITALAGVQQISTAVEETFAVQGTYLAERAASLVDGDSFEALVKSLDINDPFYEAARQKLLLLKENAGCLYLYTMAPSSGGVWRYIIDGSAEPDDTENFSQLGDEEDISSQSEACVKAFALGRTEPAPLSYQDGWGWVISFYTPIKNSAGKTVGIAACDFDGVYLHNTIIASQKQQLIIGGVSLALGLALLAFLLRAIFSRLHTFNVILKGISLGEGDLTTRISIDKDDEIGEMASHFNLTLDKMRNLIIVIKTAVANLHTIGGGLASRMDQTTRAVRQITDVVNTVKQKASSQAGSVNQANSVMKLIVSNIDKMGVNVEAQTSSAAQSSSAIEDMLANVQSVTQTLVINQGNVEQLIMVSEESRSGLEKVSRDIQKIAKESEGLLEINSVMENIASQTNLLSMNAAIEAAHAGDAGKGFAVVAQEIRKLATDSSEQSQTIAKVLKKIKIAIDAITESTGIVLENFRAIDERVGVVSKQEANIRLAMEEQVHSSQKVLEIVEKMNELTQMVKQGTMEMFEGSREVIRESKILETASTEITEGMIEMSSGAEQINAAIHEVNGISNKNRDCIAALVTEVSRFKVDGENPRV